MLYSRVIAYLMLTLSYTVLLFGAWSLEGSDTLKIIVFSSIVAVMTICGIAIWTIPVIDAYTRERIDELLEVEE